MPTKTVVRIPFMDKDTAKNAVVISSREMVEMLSAHKGATFATIIVETEPKLKKTGNPFVGVTKMAKVNICLNFQYEAGVLRRLAKEGKSEEDFKRGESWHTPVLNADGGLTPFCQHKTNGKIYLRSMLVNPFGHQYFDANGNELTDEQVNPFLPAKSDYSNQGLTESEPLRFLVYGLDGIKSITFGGTTYLIRG